MTTAQSKPSAAGNHHKIAYVMSRFPKISETFILYEIVELERLGRSVEVFPLIREKENIVHPEAQAIVGRAHYSKAYDRKVLAAHRYWLGRSPRRYLQLWSEVLGGNLGTPKFLARAVIVLLQAAWFARRMEELGISHVHAHFATHPALAAYAVNRLTGIPYSFTVHADDIYMERPMLDKKILHSSFVVSISDYNRQFLQRHYGSLAEAKVVVLHCGVDTAIFQPRAARPLGDKLVITTVARLEEKKGHSFLVDACAQLRDRGVNFVCQLIGDGELRPQVEAQIAQLGLSDRVLLMGRQPRSRVQELLAASDVMVLPSITTKDGRQEGIPVALMEAMATELPVISTAISGIPELIDHGRSGLLVPDRNAEALANALQLLASSPQVGQQLGSAGRIKVLQEFDLQRNTAALSRYLAHDKQAGSLDLRTLERAL
jgi:colanic acid/amylovoran biosynthesis glycosyltransferase